MGSHHHASVDVLLCPHRAPIGSVVTRSPIIFRKSSLAIVVPSIVAAFIAVVLCRLSGHSLSKSTINGYLSAACTSGMLSHVSVMSITPSKYATSYLLCLFVVASINLLLLSFFRAVSSTMSRFHVFHYIHPFNSLSIQVHKYTLSVRLSCACPQIMSVNRLILLFCG